MNISIIADTRRQALVVSSELQSTLGGRIVSKPYKPTARKDKKWKSS